jgi:DNA-binding HxlR family transcriptional regulator
MISRDSITEEKPGCIQATLDIIGDKWTGLLLRELTECPKTFSELEQQLSGISPRTLSQRLDKLESECITTKSLYCEHPPRYKYALTKKGSDLKTVLHSMADWGEKYSQT